MRLKDLDSLFALIDLFVDVNIYSNVDPDTDEQPTRFKLVNGDGDEVILDLDKIPDTDDEVKFTVVSGGLIVNCDYLKLGSHNGQVIKIKGHVYLSMHVGKPDSKEIGVIRI